MTAKDFFAKYLPLGYPVPEVPPKPSLQQQILDLGTAMAYIIEAANMINANQAQMASDIANLAEELRILRAAQNGA